MLLVALLEFAALRILAALPVAGTGSCRSEPAFHPEQTTLRIAALGDPHGEIVAIGHLRIC